MRLPATEFLDQLVFAANQELEDKLFRRWIVGGQYEMSFAEFKRKLTPPKFKSEKAVLADTERILRGLSNGNI